MPAPRLLYLVTEDWYFLSHRLPMARAAREAGFKVHVATRIGRHRKAIEAEGFQLHPLNWRRGSTNPFAAGAAVSEIRQLYQTVHPDIVHHVALQASVLGSLAALRLPLQVVNAVTGMGYAFTSGAAKAKLAGLALGRLMRALFRRHNSTVLVQNPDDRAAMLALGVAPDRIVLVPGSGVDTERLRPLPEPKGPVTAAFVGRLLRDKGVETLMAAHKRLADQGHTLRLLLAGEPDPANPASVSPQQLAEWRTWPGVEFLGHVADIRSVWAAAHIAVLPSRREGLPLSLLEAAACARPIVATDAPGCREVARPEVNALLVPLDDAEALAGALARLADDPDLRARFGRMSREMAEAEFSTKRIGADIVALYRALLARQPSLPGSA